MKKTGRETKPHIGIFGRRNNGKSSFINALAEQNIAIVSDTAGTTTDPVKKSVEIFGVGPSVMIDTAGIDDTGDLGKLRIEKTLQVVKIIDMAILLVVDNTIGPYEEQLIDEFRKYDVPFFFVHGKSDIEPVTKRFKKEVSKKHQTEIIEFSTQSNNTEVIIAQMVKQMPPSAYNHPSILKPVLRKGDLVLLITPIDLEAPEGRMILPQVQAIRDVLDNDCIAMVMKETQVEGFLKQTNIKPALAITDSQAFGPVCKIIPDDIPLTGFSVMLAHYKGNFKAYLKGTPQISNLQDGDKILILESCTHQVNCDDIGRYKIPAWLKEHTGKKLSFDVVSGLSELPGNLRQYALAIQCGGCMITRKQIESRLKQLIDNHVPVTNYGMTIAYLHGIFDRAVGPFLKLN